VKSKTQTFEENLLPFSDFQKIAAKVLSVSKEDSDKQMEEFQASNPNGKTKKAEKPKQKKTA
jgi:ABC-type transporter MlaC component